MHHHSNLRRNLVALIVGLVTPGASARIVQIDARISAEVQQFDSGQASSFDSAFEEFRTTAVSLPIQVVASLLPAVEDVASNAFGAVAYSDFRDPTISAEVNPGEFGLEANVFSLDPFVSFQAAADATENRLIELNDEDLEAVPGETEREAESSAFISGAILIWTLDPTRDLSGLSVQFNFSVDLRLADADPEIVFSALVTTQGRADGEVSFAASNDIVAEVGGEELLTDAIGSQGALLLEELEGLGRIHVILIPEQELTYRYIAPLNERFNLVAGVEVRSTSLPAGTGAGAVFGRSFEDLAQVIAEFIAFHTDGTLTQRAVNKALADLNAQVNDGAGNGGQGSTSGRAACGLLGMEMIVLPLGLWFLSLRGRRGE